LIRSITAWRPGEPPQEASEGDPGERILWVDLAPTAKPDTTSELLGRLASLCPGLTAEMLEDLVTPDEEPEGRSYGDGSIRLASSFAVRVVPAASGAGERGVAQGVGKLVFEPVELLSSADWLVTCWHPTRVFFGAAKTGEGEAPGCDELRAEVARHWESGRGRNAGDLGVLVMHELALGYAEAHRALYGWLEDWELGLYVGNGAERDALARLWGSMAVLRDWLTVLNRPGLSTDIDRAWLPAGELDGVADVNRRVDSSLLALSELGQTLRASFGLLHVQLGEEQRERAELIQRRIELVGAALLVPTLIVGFYGANTWVPGVGSHWGFWVMVVALIVFTTISVALVRRWHAQQEAAARRAAAERDHLRQELGPR
jgi:CorA-like Mg2+ transporter protein